MDEFPEKSPKRMWEVISEFSKIIEYYVNYKPKIWSCIIKNVVVRAPVGANNKRIPNPIFSPLIPAHCCITRLCFAIVDLCH